MPGIRTDRFRTRLVIRNKAGPVTDNGTVIRNKGPVPRTGLMVRAWQLPAWRPDPGEDIWRYGI